MDWTFRDPSRLPQRRRDDSDATFSHPLTALVVDDDENFAAYIAAMAKKIGFTVEYAGDGVAAAATLQHAHFDLLLIDLSMPRMDGIELIGKVRTESSSRESYAVMITAHDDIPSKLAALAAGFDDFLSKGGSEAEVVAKLAAARRMLSRQQALDVAVRNLYALATRDELTGVYNRRFFVEEAERLLRERSDIGLMIFDLDDFKIANDTWGHLAGDQILRDVGALFLRTTRSEDIIARYGGDEFVILVNGLGADSIERVAARIASQIAGLRWGIGAESVGIGVTTGVAIASLLDQPSLPRLLNAADRDLYKNKWLRKHPGSPSSDAEQPEEESGSLTAILLDDRR